MFRRPQYIPTLADAVDDARKCHLIEMRRILEAFVTLEWNLLTCAHVAHPRHVDF